MCNEPRFKKILLGMMPYWSPLVPPQGIGMLKSFLQKNGYTVSIFDTNIEDKFREIYYEYFDRLEEYIPIGNRGNFYNIGHDILQNQMMAHIKYIDESMYIELIKVLINNTYYVNIDTSQAYSLKIIMDRFYTELEKYIKWIIEKETPDVVGFSLLKTNIPATLFTARLIKKLFPHIKIVTGGGAFADSHAIDSPNFETLVKECNGSIDKILIGGQGEVLLLYILQNEMNNPNIVYTLKSINKEPLDFASLSIADFSGLDVSKYPYLIATGSSSCPNECSFCNSSKFWGKFKKKEIKQTANEMITMYEKYGNQLFFMSDALLNPIIDELANSLYDLGVCLYYDCYFRVDDPSGNVNNTMAWRKGGLYRTRLGVESGSQKVLDMMHKNITVDQTKATISALAEAGIKTTTYWVIGHPGETEEDFRMTLDLLEDLANDIWQAECNPFYYHYSGQFESDEWSKNRMLLYPEKFSDILSFKTWTLNCDPLREERYKRMFRFTEHCKKLGIPNPYNAKEIYEADIRWKHLHKNAVPAVFEFKRNGVILNEARDVEQYFDVTKPLNMQEFNFNI